MSVDMYNALSLDELKYLAGREGVKSVERYSRDELIDILEEIWEDKVADRKLNNDIMRLKGKKYDIYREDLNGIYRNTEYVIPDHYPRTSIHLLLRDPYWVYAYWDINQFELQNLIAERPDPGFTLRVYELADRSLQPDDAVSSFEIPVRAEDSSWYINLPNPGRWYLVDLVCRDEEGAETLLCRSHKLESPGGYWLEHTDELKRDPVSYKLFLAGYSGGSEYFSDSVLIQKILADLEQSPDGAVRDRSALT